MNNWRGTMAHAADPEAGDVVPQHLLNLPPVGKWVGMADTTTAVFFHGTEIVWAKAGQPPVHHATPGAGQLLHVLLGSNNVVLAINPIVRRAYKIKGPVWRADGHVDEPEHIATTPVPSDAPAPSAVLLPGGRTVVAVFAVDQVVGYDANYAAMAWDTETGDVHLNITSTGLRGLATFPFDSTHVLLMRYAQTSVRCYRICVAPPNVGDNTTLFFEEMPEGLQQPSRPLVGGPVDNVAVHMCKASAQGQRVTALLVGGNTVARPAVFAYTDVTAQLSTAVVPPSPHATLPPDMWALPAISPDGRWMALAAGSTVIVVDLRTKGTLVCRTINRDDLGSVLQFHFSPDSSQLYAKYYPQASFDLLVGVLL
jgi:hypothetical protein